MRGAGYAMREWRMWRRAAEWSGGVKVQVAWKRRRRHGRRKAAAWASWKARVARGRHCRSVRAAEAAGGGAGERRVQASAAAVDWRRRRRGLAAWRNGGERVRERRRVGDGTDEIGEKRERQPAVSELYDMWAPLFFLTPIDPTLRF